MLISREREKLLEAIKFFAANTKHCGLVKTFKLLYFLDFDHFRETGRSVTGLNYQAWEMGPVPNDLYNEIKGRPAADIAAQLRIENPTVIEQDAGPASFQTDAVNTWGGDEAQFRRTTHAHVPAKIKALKPFNPKLFSKRELRMMERLAEIYRDATAKQMSEVSHLKGRPWQVTKSKHGLKAPIDYRLVLDEPREGAPTKEEILEMIEERREVLDALK